MASDASETTVALYGLNGRLKNFQFTQALLPHEVTQSLTYREMSAVLKTLLCFDTIFQTINKLKLSFECGIPRPQDVGHLRFRLF
jgi:hypothetical protein